MPVFKLGFPMKTRAVGDEAAKQYKAGEVVDITDEVFENYKHVKGLFLKPDSEKPKADKK